MNHDFPYQLVAFIDRYPKIGESVYNGNDGWFPQVALKRRFKVINIDEQALILRIRDFCESKKAFSVTTSTLIKHEKMPVSVIDINQTQEIMAFNKDFISFMGNNMVSRYPDRDGVDYLPHVTAEYDDELVIDVDRYTNKTFEINKIYLLKDLNEGLNQETTVANCSFNLI